LNRRRTRPSPRSKTSEARPAAISRGWTATGSVPLERQAAVGPLAPRAGVQAAVATAEPGAVKGHAGRDARAAVGDELAGRQPGQRLVPGSVGCAGDPAGWIVDLVRLAAPAIRRACIDEEQRRVGEAAGDLLRLDRVVTPQVRVELGRPNLLLAGPQLAAPDVDSAEQDGTVVVAEVAEQPPQPLDPTPRALCPHVDSCTRPRPALRSG